MRFRDTMMLVLVVWLLVGGVRSHHDAPAQDDRARRAYQRRRMLERLALRGYEARERERLAEELLARLESHHTSTSSPLWRQLHEHHRSPSRQHNSQIFQGAPYLEVASLDQVYPQLEILREEEEVETQLEEEPEFAKVSMELEETKDVLRQFLIREIFPDKTKTRRHVAEEIVTEQTTRRSARAERRKAKEEKKRKKEEKKKKRGSKKNKKRKQEREFESFLRNQSIPIHDVDGDRFFDCCPSKLIVVQKAVGKASNNRAVEIMETQDTFYERVCLDEVLDQECIFPARFLKKGVVTRCTQEWSFSQAFSRPYDSSLEFQVSHIQVRSGCSCQVSLTHKKKRKRKR